VQTAAEKMAKQLEEQDDDLFNASMRPFIVTTSFSKSIHSGHVLP
jgi:hypothetical protein